MAYIIKAHFYCGLDQTGESYVITSDNDELDTKLEVGRRVHLIIEDDSHPVSPGERERSE